MPSLEFNWWETIILFLLIVVANIVCFPCFLMQMMGLKAKFYSRMIWKVGFEQFTFYDIYKTY